MICKQHKTRQPVSDIGECPHCIISQLRAELAEAKQAEGKAIAALQRWKSAAEKAAAELRVLTSKLEKAQVVIQAAFMTPTQQRTPAMNIARKEYEED